MPPPDALNDEATAIAAEIAELALESGRTVAVAESLTGGKVACHLAAAPSSGEWFRGGVVAYASEVKYDVLGVPPGPVVTESCASAMARGVAGLLGADCAVAVTGVGGPDPQEGQPPGTVCFGAVGPEEISGRSAGRSEQQHFSGEPEQVLDQTTVHALRMLRELLG
jgi:nicotinamide-nucleotide amidase